MFEAGAGKTRIDVRSVWFLLLYASDLLERLTDDQRERLVSGERDNDLPDALAEVLAARVERRARSMLVRGYRTRSEPLTRVRGRIDHLRTARARLMDSGRVQCRFEEQTVDLPRYRFILLTMRLAAHRASSADVRRRCLTTAQMLERLGVKPIDPTMQELSKEQFGHFDSDDRALLLICRLVRAMYAPEHAPGANDLPAIVRDESALRTLFESAVRGFYRFHLGRRGFSVRSESAPWPAAGAADSLAYLPRLNADIVVRGHGRQLVVECKFAPIFDLYYDRPIVKPAYLRQVYSYGRVFALEKQCPTEALLLGALVKGSPGADLDVVIDGIAVRVRQLDLSSPPSALRQALSSAASNWAGLPILAQV